LLSYGVPPEWLADVRKVNEDGLLVLAEHLPAEAAEALLELATGGAPKPVAAIQPGADPFSHSDAQRRFRVMKDIEELERALDFPMGEVDRLPSPSAAAMGRTRLHRAGTNFRLGRYW
jgi:hypothetical protein